MSTTQSGIFALGTASPRRRPLGVETFNRDLVGADSYTMPAAMLNRRQGMMQTA